MSIFPEGNAIVYCDHAFGTPNGKTAHGLVRRSRRYRILSVIDSELEGQDAGMYLDGKVANIPVVADLTSAIRQAYTTGATPSHFVIGIAPDGGRLENHAREMIKEAIAQGLHVDCGLHDFLTDDPELVALASQHKVRLRDVRKPKTRSELHFFCGKIAEVNSLKIAVLGTDSAVGKRTTAWLLVDALNAAGYSAEMIGTGQTAWLQGARYGIILDSLVNDFVAGEIEHAVWSAWSDLHPAVIVIEGQGSLLNPAFPGGFEILAAARPEIIILQHAPARKEYDGFPGYPIHPLEKQIQAIELIADRRVVAITINHEHLPAESISRQCKAIAAQTGLPTYDVLLEGADQLAAHIIQNYLQVPTK
ncbi:MAG: DUF1611 domain-containing protein [candidate division KSB1 bacterium]|nr:DUF1611 domain-containing protein [candidate division KSB1 bacterium]MDZ7318016.1 DUF1611 domain-containing protein [candidate division KSB1 bacterium]MDZ7341585.1 DUF1611 domain-containing protein [candidate division KSB1 bacterium]